MRQDPIGRFGHGSGEVVTVEGTVNCGCGAEMHLRFRGHEDSMGVRVTRQALKSPQCEECTDRQDAEAQDRQRGEHQAALRAQRTEKSGVPPRWRAVTFERLERDPKRLPAIEAAEAWASDANAQGLLLWGGVGRGKTLIAAAAAMRRLHRRRLRWVPVAELLMDLRGGFDSPTAARALAKLDSDCDAALVLDDMDKLNPTAHQLQPLYTVINEWLERPLPLLITMNRSPDELAEWAGETFGEALASRIAGYCTVVEVQGRDRRMD